MEFLKQEHAVMLHGLHEEIKQLQNQCSDMQLQLISHGIVPSDKEMLQDELKELESKYEEKRQDCKILREQLDVKRRVIEDLEQQIENKDERYREDISARNLIIVRLRKEVQEKASTIASLVAFVQSKNKNTDKLKSCTKKSLPSPVVPRDEEEMSLSRKICRRLASGSGGTSANGTNSPTIGRQIIEKYFRSSSLPPIPSSSQQSPIKLSAQLNCSMKNISI